MSDNTPQSGSLIDRLKAKRKEIEAARSIDITIPGWDGMLKARYKSLPWEVVRGFSDGIEEPTPAQELVVAWDTLLAACDCILMQQEDGSYEPLGDPPVRYDDRLARYTGEEDASSPHEVIDSTFPNEVALMTHFGSYMEWLSGGDKQVASELGKSSSQTDG